MRHRSAGRRTIAVALHDIEPATFERCALIRDWLNDHGVDRVTLLVIPARDLHPLGERSPEMTSWLAERRSAGDSIAQHGFQHEQLRRSALSRSTLMHAGKRRSAEFVGLDGDETRRAVDAGWRGPLQRTFSPALIRAGGLLCGDTLRLDVHPADLEHPRHMIALEWVLHRAGRRRAAITYDELLASRN